jgi:hypothetical protein
MGCAAETAVVWNELTDLQTAASSAQTPGYPGYGRSRPGKFTFTKLV